MRIAIIGGADYLEADFEDWLYKLHAKYPDAIIVTGTAGGKNEYEDIPGSFDKKGNMKRKVARQIPSAEGMAASLMPGLGHTVVIPDTATQTALYLKNCGMSMSDLQIAWILGGQSELYRKKSGSLHHRFITPRADIIVAVGNPDSSRAREARDHWKRFDQWRERENRRPFISVAAPVKAQQTKKYKATKKVETLAA